MDDVDEMNSYALMVKEYLWRLFGPYCDRRLKTFTFHLLDHFDDNLKGFRNVFVLSASSYQSLIFIFKSGITVLSNIC